MKISIAKSGNFFYWGTLYTSFEKNYNLILELLEYHIPHLNSDGREHIIYSLHGGLHYQKFILSSLSNESYGVMFSLIRVAIENIFLSLWLGYNMGKVEPYEDKSNPLNSSIYYSVGGKGFKYGDFIKSFCIEKEKSDIFHRETFDYDFLCKSSHGDGIGAIFEYFKANSLIDENKVEENYKKMGMGYILFLQWAQLYSIKNLFSYTYNFSITQENLLKNLNLTLGHLEDQINKKDKEIFKKILEDKGFRKCELIFTRSK